MRRREILMFALILVSLRVLFLLGSLDPSQEPVREIMDQAGAVWNHGPERPLFDREELYTATAAEAIRMGLDLPLDTYRFMAYGSGSLLVSLMAVPLYAWLGPDYLVFKIIPLLVTLIGGVFWLLVVRDWAGARAARLFAALYILGPSVLVRTTLISKGDHPEAMAIAGVILWAGTRAARGRAPGARTRWALLAGLVMGLGVYATYSTVPVTGGVLLGAALITRLRPRRLWLAAALGLAVGLAPWLIVIAQTQGAALRVYETGLADTGMLAEAGGRAKLLLTSGFLSNYDLPGGSAPRRLAAILFTLAVAGGWVGLFRRGRQPAAVLTGLGTVAFLAAFCLRAPDPSSRYLLPGYPLLLIAIALWAGANESGKRWCRLGTAAVLLLAVMGLAAQAGSLADSRFTALRAPLRGTDWPLLGEIAGQKLVPAQIEALPDQVRPFFWVGLGIRIQHEVAPELWPEAAALAGPLEARWVYEGIGVALGQVPGWEKIAAITLPRLPPEHRFALRRGMARYAAESLPQLTVAFGPALTDRVIATLDPEDQPEMAAAAARVTAALATHGVAMGRQAPPQATESYLASLQHTARLSNAAGWALWRGVQRDGTPRLWNPPAEAWTAPLARALEDQSAPAACWQGAAAAYERMLTSRSGAWLLGIDADGPAALAKELAGLLAHLPAPAHDAFLQAAGRACAAALREPGARPPGWTPTLWHWQPALPPPWRNAFGAGLRTAFGSGVPDA